MICLLVCVWRTHVCVFLCVCVHAFFYACVWVMCMALMRVVWPCNARHNPDMVIIMHKAFIIAAHRKTTIPLSLLRESIHSTAAKAFHMPCISCAMYFVDMPFLGVPHPTFSGEIWEADFSSFLHSESQDGDLCYFCDSWVPLPSLISGSVPLFRIVMQEFNALGD